MHVPVLLKETVENLLTDPKGIYIDCTLGGGGHTLYLAGRLKPEGRIIALDKDKEVIKLTQSTLTFPGIKIIHADFRNLRQIILNEGISKVNGIMIDLGVSSFQLDQAERGFSFHENAPLDMRMNREQEENAAYLVNNLSEAELADILFKYGEERYARRIARAIVKYRINKLVTETLELVDIIKSAVPAVYKKEKHPARRTFQAIRIAVNREMEALEKVLPQAVEMLKPGGRLCIITFHSLEDRIVKRFLQQKSRECICPTGTPVCICEQKPELRLIQRKGIIADETENASNPRSRSARLRVAEKI